MKETSYHHKNLKEDLVAAGITLVKSQTQDSLSLRKVASMCGVSAAATYTHFESKTDLIRTIQQEILHELYEELIQRTETGQEKTELLLNMGILYVNFFSRNPTFFDFLYSNCGVDCNVSLDVVCNNPPLELLKQTAKSCFSNRGLSTVEIENKVIALWALVHGLSTLSAIPHIRESVHLDARLREIIGSIHLV